MCSLCALPPRTPTPRAVSLINPPPVPPPGPPVPSPARPLAGVLVAYLVVWQPSCLHLALPPPLHSRLSGLLADHGAQRSRAPFSFFRKHSCLMYRWGYLRSAARPKRANRLT